MILCNLHLATGPWKNRVRNDSYRRLHLVMWICIVTNCVLDCEFITKGVNFTRQYGFRRVHCNTCREQSPMPNHKYRANIDDTNKIITTKNVPNPLVGSRILRREIVDCGHRYNIPEIGLDKRADIMRKNSCAWVRVPRKPPFKLRKTIVVRKSRKFCIRFICIWRVLENRIRFRWRPDQLDTVKTKILLVTLY